MQSGSRTKKNPPGASPLKMRRLIHDLKIHQAELETQNKELQDSRRRLEESRDSFADLYDFAPVGYVTLDFTGHIQKINLTGAKMLQMERAKIIGRRFFRWFAAPHAEALAQHLRHCAQRNDAVTTEIELVTSNGRRTQLQLHTIPVFETQRVVGCRIAMTDVTALRQARAVAEEANCAKTTFLANMSHEMRTPLVAILGFADILRQLGDSSDEKREALGVIQRNGKHLLRLIDDLLDIAKIEAGRIDVDKVRFEVGPLIAEILKQLDNQARDKGLALHASTEGRIPAMIFSDPSLLRQILLNLIGNAIKFTSDGEVSLTARFEDAVAGESARLIMTVKDTGVGMTAEQQQRVFQPFGQADRSISRRYGGTGLGLVLSKRLARELGGDVTLVDSRPGRGSEFKITIDTGPVTEKMLFIEGFAAMPSASGPPSPFAEQRCLEGTRILVAEDTPDTQHILNLYLKTAGAEVEIAGDGVHAVDRAEQGDFDLVLMDIQMPKLDGYAATRLLRRDGFRKPIIALTAHAMQEDRERCLAAGCDAYLTKPMERQELLAKVRKYLGAPRR